MNFLKLSILTAFLTHSILSLAQNNAVPSPLCHPCIDPDMPQYIIGYGSLIQSQSRKTTYPHAENALPVMVYGYQRGWFIHGNRKVDGDSSPATPQPRTPQQVRGGAGCAGAGFGMTTKPTRKTTFLSVVHNEKSHFNGVIFKVNKEGIACYDAREEPYCREAVSPSRIKMLNHQKVPHGQFWIYVTPASMLAAPSANYPILQSYVDIFLSGCLAVQKQYGLKNFATDCIDTTYNWSSHWVLE